MNTSLARVCDLVGHEWSYSQTASGSSQFECSICNIRYWNWGFGVWEVHVYGETEFGEKYCTHVDWIFDNKVPPHLLKAWEALRD